MIIKKRSLVKLLIVVPVLWVLVLFMFSLNDSTSTGSVDKINKLQAENHRLIKEAAARHEQERIRQKKGEELKEKEEVGEDHDHPEEERKKAEEQQQERAGPIQVQAPVDRNPNAPGKDKLKDSLL